MKTKYTTSQIKEAISFWRSQLLAESLEPKTEAKLKDAAKAFAKNIGEMIKCGGLNRFEDGDVDPLVAVKNSIKKGVSVDNAKKEFKKLGCPKELVDNYAKAYVDWFTKSLFGGDKKAISNLLKTTEQFNYFANVVFGIWHRDPVISKMMKHNPPEEDPRDFGSEDGEDLDEVQALRANGNEDAALDEDEAAVKPLGQQLLDALKDLSNDDLLKSGIYVTNPINRRVAIGIKSQGFKDGVLTIDYLASGALSYIKDFLQSLRDVGVTKISDIVKIVSTDGKYECVSVAPKNSMGNIFLEMQKPEDKHDYKTEFKDLLAEQNGEDAENINSEEDSIAEEDIDERYDRYGGFGGYGRSYSSYGSSAPRGAAIGWYSVADVDPACKTMDRNWRFGPIEFTRGVVDFLYPERQYKRGATMLRYKNFRMPNDGGIVELYVGIASIFDAVKNNDEEALKKLDMIGINRNITLGLDPDDDYSAQYVLR